MKWATVVFGIVLLAFAAANVERSDLPLAEPCDPEKCKLPNCRCSNSDIPGNLEPRDTPQFVLLTFDDGVNVVNIETYRNFYRRRNRNGCPAGISFYVSHEYTNYRLVNELYNQGYEIALHSITHSTPQTYWAQATYETLMLEFADQRTQMAHFANIPRDELQGVRMPFLQMAGNRSFEMMKSAGFQYDISWPTFSHANPGLWPYTLDYASVQDCMISPCPTASLPGTWVLPMITWTDLEDFPCSFVDACVFRPDLEDEEAWFRFILTNFERHYKGNRAPFGFYVHEWFLSVNPAVFRALNRFLDLINNLHDTFMVTSKDVIDWTRRPVKLDEYVRQPCKNRRPAGCAMRSCGPLSASHTTEMFWMQICSNTCPVVYPWLRNPLGR